VLLDPHGDKMIANYGVAARTGVRIDRKPHEVKRRGAFHGPFTLVHGYVTLMGMPYVPDVLRRSRLSARTEVLDQRQVVVLKGSGQNGQLKLWCDPQTDFWPRKLEWRMGPEDLLDDKKLKQRLLESITILVDGWDFARVSDRWVPTRFTLHHAATHTDKPPAVSRSVCTFSDISIAPAHLNDPAAFQLGSEIPNGTPVTVSSEPQIAYIWQDGKAVKKIDVDPAVLEGYGISDTEAPKSFITLWAIAALSAVLIAFLLAVWRLRAAKS
jgi:hypothetical protein